jgi:phage/plasmid-associated DNA primase
MMIYNETFNVQKLELLIRTFEQHPKMDTKRLEFICDDPKILLTKYLSGCSIKDNTGIASVIYTQSDNGKGRKYALASLGLQMIPRPFRHTICNEYYYDIDIKNAHPEILLQYANKNNITLNYLKQYCKHRTKWFNELNKIYKLDKDLIKISLLKIINGGSSNIFKNDDKPDYIDGFINDIDVISKFIFRNESEIADKAMDKQRMKKYDNKLGSSVNLLMCQIENMILDCMINYLKQINIITDNAVLVFDGFQLLKDSIVNTKYENNLEELLQELKEEVKLKLDYKIELVIKPMGEAIELNESDFKSISDIKFEYNSNNVLSEINKLNIINTIDSNKKYENIIRLLLSCIDVKSNLQFICECLSKKKSIHYNTNIKIIDEFVNDLKLVTKMYKSAKYSNIINLFEFIYKIDRNRQIVYNIINKYFPIKSNIINDDNTTNKILNIDDINKLFDEITIFKTNDRFNDIHTSYDFLENKNRMVDLLNCIPIDKFNNNEFIFKFGVCLKSIDESFDETFYKYASTNTNFNLIKLSKMWTDDFNNPTNNIITITDFLINEAKKDETKYKIYSEKYFNQLDLDEIIFKKFTDKNLAEFFYNKFKFNYITNETNKQFYTYNENNTLKSNNSEGDCITHICTYYTNILQSYEEELKEKLKFIEDNIQFVNPNNINNIYKIQDKLEKKQEIIKNNIYLIGNKKNEDIFKKLRHLYIIKLFDLKYLNHRKDCIYFNNTVFDSSINDFRNIEKNDFCSITTGYNHNHSFKNYKLVIDFLKKIWGDDIEKVNSNLKLLAAGLFTNMKQLIIIHLGNGANGKSIINFVMEMIYGHYFGTGNNDLLTNDDNERNDCLFNSRYCKLLMVSEPAKGSNTARNAPITFNSTMVKKLSGGEPIYARKTLSSEIAKYTPSFTVHVLCNKLPVFEECNHAIKRRVNIIDYPYTFVSNPKKINERLIDEKQKEKINTYEFKISFINILIETFIGLNNNYNFKQHPHYENIKTEYFNNIDPVQNFIDSVLIQHLGSRVPIKEAFEIFKKSNDTGIYKNMSDFSDCLKNTKELDVKITMGVRYINNYKINTEFVSNLNTNNYTNNHTNNYINNNDDFIDDIINTNNSIQIFTNPIDEINDEINDECENSDDDGDSFNMSNIKASLNKKKLNN